MSSQASIEQWGFAGHVAVPHHGGRLLARGAWRDAGRAGASVGNVYVGISAAGVRFAKAMSGVG